MIQELRLRNFLSFGPETPALQLGPLNVLIGPNGSGKSNLLEAIGLLRATTGDLLRAIRSSGPTSDWIWKGQKSKFSAAELEAKVEVPFGEKLVHYKLAFLQVDGSFFIFGENIDLLPDHLPIYSYGLGEATVVAQDGTHHKIDRTNFDNKQSILVQLRDPTNYPLLARVSNLFSQFRTYRSWPLGPESPLRGFQKNDAPRTYLVEDGSNLALILNRLSNDPPTWRRIREFLKDLGQDFDDISFEIDVNTTRFMMRETNFVTPSSRLSDGTLRFLCLVAVLLDPKPAPLICIDEPELGFHPDAVHEVAELLKDASTRTQLIVTTHSRELLDAISDKPESVIVFDRKDGQTQMNRLGSKELMDWAKGYGIGKAWREGEFGGNRW
jgi:predicted ATPase